MRVTKFTRRQFLKRMSVAAAGAAVASIPLISACKSSNNPGTETSTNVGTNLVPPTSSVLHSPSPVPSSNTVTSSPIEITSKTPSESSANLATTIPVLTSYSYIPPTASPPLLSVLNSSCLVAADRLYTLDHNWVKTISTNIVVIGITTTMVEIVSEPYKLQLDKVGSTVTRNNGFGVIEGFKMSADLLSPVSGRVLQIDDYLISLSNQSTGLVPVMKDTYNSGWMMVVQLSKPDELKLLVTAQSYRDSVSYVGDK